MASVSEFVGGGVQETCDDACSICLEDFCAQDPASITGCNHAYHLQCILEWVQRSSECPMCWQPLVMKDVVGQELLASAVQDRSLRANKTPASFLPLRSEDYELDQFASFEERFTRRLAATSSRQVHGHGRKNNFNFRPPSIQHSGQILSPPNQTSTATGTLEASDSAPEAQSGDGGSHSTFAFGAISPRHSNVRHPHPPSAGSFTQGASTSELQSFSDAIKSRLTAAPSKYKETFLKMARLCREKMRARNVSHSDPRVRSQDFRTCVDQAPGKTSLEAAAGDRRNRAKTSPFILLKQTCILETKQSDAISTNITSPSKIQDISTYSFPPTAVETADSLGGETLVTGEQAITIA